jgi:hypothetical protein
MAATPSFPLAVSHFSKKPSGSPPIVISKETPCRVAHVDQRQKVRVRLRPVVAQISNLLYRRSPNLRPLPQRGCHDSLQEYHFFGRRQQNQTKAAPVASNAHVPGSGTTNIKGKRMLIPPGPSVVKEIAR